MSPPPPSGEQTGLHEAGRDIRNGSVGGVSLWWKFRNRGADNKRGANHYLHQNMGENDIREVFQYWNEVLKLDEKNIKALSTTVAQAIALQIQIPTLKEKMDKLIAKHGE